MKEKLPLVSVIVPCYNHEEYIEECIKSIINQTYKNIELIVIDDGSKDSSPKLLKELSLIYNFHFEYQKNIGLSATLNKMINMSTGKYIALVASDDIYTLNKIEILVTEFENLDEDYGIVCGNAQFINNKSEKLFHKKNNNKYYDLISYYISSREDINIFSEFGSYTSILASNYIPALSTLIKRNILIEVGLYEEEITLEDWNMWLKLSKKYKMKYINEVVAFYRWHDSNISKTMYKKLAMDTIYILEREKEYCKNNNLMDVWRKKYYHSIVFLLRNKDYREFMYKVLYNNAFLFTWSIIKKVLLKSRYL